MDLGYLEHDRWEREYTKAVLAGHVVEARTVTHQAVNGELDGVAPDVAVVTVFYSDLDEFERLAKDFGVMDNIKAKVPRTAYHGVVSFWQRHSSPPRKVHLAPWGLADTLRKAVVVSNTDYDQSQSKRKQNFLRPRIQY